MKKVRESIMDGESSIYVDLFSLYLLETSLELT